MKKEDKFEGFSRDTINFIHNLGLNNERGWFEAHKAEFQKVFLGPMKTLSRTVFDRVSSKYGDYGFINKVSRIYRDARYLRAGDGPYRTSLWFSIEKPVEREWTDTPVFWFDLSPESWSYGMGYGGARAETMTKLRARIDEDPKKFEKLVVFLEGQTEFMLEGDEYVRKKEAPSAKTAPWYNKKSFSLIHRQMNGEELFSADLADRIAEGMMVLMPVYEYLVTLETD